MVPPEFGSGAPPWWLERDNLHLLEAKGATQTQLSQETEIAKSTISELLLGKKTFSRQIIRKFSDYFREETGTWLVVCPDGFA